MKTLRIIAVALALPAAAFAAGAGRGGAQMTAHRSTAQTQTLRGAQSQTMRSMRTATTRSPAHATGQPGAECGSATAPNTPGHAASAPGSAFNEDGVAGSKYAGTQPQNSRNTASVSQYDAACLHQR